MIRIVKFLFLFFGFSYSLNIYDYNLKKNTLLWKKNNVNIYIYMSTTINTFNNYYSNDLIVFKIIVKF